MTAAAGGGGRWQKAVEGGSGGKQQQQWALRLRVWRRGDGGGERERRARRGSYEGRRIPKAPPSAGGGGEGERGLSVVDGLVDGLCLSMAGALHEHAYIYQSALLAPPRQLVALPAPTLAPSIAPAPLVLALALVPLREAMCRAAALGAPGASRFHARLAMPAWALARFARLLVRMVSRLLPLAHPPLLLPPQAARGPFTIVVGLAADATAGRVATDAGLNAGGAAREGSGAAGTGWEGGDGSDGGGGGKVHGGTGWEGGKVHGGEAAAAAVSAAAAATVAAAAAAAAAAVEAAEQPLQPLLLLSVGGGAVGGACHMPPSAGGIAVAASDGSGTAPLELTPLLEALAAHGRLAETAPPPSPAKTNAKAPLLATPATPNLSLAIAATAAAAVATVARTYAPPSYAAPAVAEDDDETALSRSQQAWGEAMLPLAPVLRQWRRRLLLAPPLPSAPQPALGWASGSPTETSTAAAAAAVAAVAAAVAMPMAPPTMPPSSAPLPLPSLLESFLKQAARHLHERGLGRLLARPSLPAEGSRSPTPPQQRRGCGAAGPWAGTAAPDAPSWRARLNKSRMPPPSLDMGAAAGDRLLERPGSACGGAGGGGGGCGSSGGSGGDEGAASAGVELLLASRAGCLRLLRLSPGGVAEKGVECKEGEEDEEGQEGGGVAYCTSLLLGSAPSAEADMTPPPTASGRGGRSSGGRGGGGVDRGGGGGGVANGDCEGDCRPPDEPDDLEEELDAAWYELNLRLSLALTPTVTRTTTPRPKLIPTLTPALAPNPSPSAKPSPNPNPTLNPTCRYDFHVAQCTPPSDESETVPPRCDGVGALLRLRASFPVPPPRARTEAACGEVRRSPFHPSLPRHTTPTCTTAALRPYPNPPTTRLANRTHTPAATRRPASLPLSQICAELPELAGSAAQRRGTFADFLDFVVATPTSLDGLALSRPSLSPSQAETPSSEPTTWLGWVRMNNAGTHDGASAASLDSTRPRSPDRSSTGGHVSPAAFELPSAEAALRLTAETLRFHPCGRAGAVSFMLPPPYEAYACLVWVVSAPTTPSSSAAVTPAPAAAAPAPAVVAAAPVAAPVAAPAAVAEPVAEPATEPAVDLANDPQGAEMKIEPKGVATAVAEAIAAVAWAAVEGAMSAESASAAVAVATDKAPVDKAPADKASPDRMAAAPASEASELTEATETEAAKAAEAAEVAEPPAATAADEAEAEAPCRLALMLVGPRGSEAELLAGEAEKETAGALAMAAAGGAASGAASGGAEVAEGAEHDVTPHGSGARRAAARRLATQLVEKGLRSRWAKYRSFSVWRQLNGGGAPFG